MTRTEHLLTILAEEGAEVAQRATKALRFSLSEVQPGQPFTNAERILAEFNDLQAMIEMLQREGALSYPSAHQWNNDISAKTAKVEHYLKLSAECGTLNATSTRRAL